MGLEGNCGGLTDFGCDSLLIQDEGVPLSSASTLNFVGPGVSVAVVNGVGTITISNGGVPSPEVGNIGQYITGQYYSPARGGTSLSTFASVANQIKLSPFYVDRVLSIDQYNAVVTIGAVGSNFKILVYAADVTTGWPTTLLYASPDLSGVTPATLSVSSTFTFNPLTRYWIGTHTSDIITFRAPVAASFYKLSYGGAGTTMDISLSQTVTYANGPPSPYVFATANLANTVLPHIYMRSI